MYPLLTRPSITHSGDACFHFFKDNPLIYLTFELLKTTIFITEIIIKLNGKMVSVEFYFFTP